MKDIRVEPSDQMDTTIPNVARAYDFLLGGSPVRRACRKTDPAPERRGPAESSISAPGGAFMIDEGIRRFLDIGSGTPTVDVHETTQAAGPGMFAGFDLVEPRGVGCSAWRAEVPGDFSEAVPADRLFSAGVGRKPAANRS